MGYYTRSQLITRDKLNNIPNEIIHFCDGGYIHFPLDIYNMEKVMIEFGDYETINDINNNKSKLLDSTLQIINLVEKLDINSFLIEYLEDVGEWYPLMEFFQFIIKDKIIFKESLISNVDENGHLYCESILNFDYNYKDDFFTDYDDAKEKYLKETKL